MSKIDEGKLIPYHSNMPFPPPRIAQYFVIQYEDARFHDEAFYLECLEVLYRYGLRDRPSDPIEQQNDWGVKHG